MKVCCISQKASVFLATLMSLKFAKKYFKVLILCFFGSISAADFRDEISYTHLKSLLKLQGKNLPDGSDVPVLLAEACGNAIDDDNDPETPPICLAWLPDTTGSQFQGISINNATSSNSDLFSNHATGVAKLLFGNIASIAPGINQVDAYLADHWLDDGYLKAGSPAVLPAISVNRIANHSWVGSADTELEDTFSDIDILHRIDWLINRDEFIQIVGLSNGTINPPLLSSAFNVIAVGRSDNGHGSDSKTVDSIYTAGRSRPDLVAPLSTTSSATPVITSAAALLIDVGHNDVSLSTDTEELSTVNRAGEIIFNAERSEVIKAILMAGADRRTKNHQLLDYRLTTATQTNNGLDSRFGAGQVNIASSYSILVAGEQNSAEDTPEGISMIKPKGFDYDPAFGGLNESNIEANYSFSTESETETLFVSLVWNIRINHGTTDFANFVRLYDLNLILLDVTNNPVIIATSDSKNNNSENIWMELQSNRNYRLKVVVNSNQAAFNWDYALAWRREVDSDRDQIVDSLDNCLTIFNPGQRDTDGDGFGNLCDADLDNNDVVSFADLDLFKNRFGSTHPDADFDGSGSVSFSDLYIFHSLFGQPPGPIGEY
jgi:hypothetical protein